jgi:hypothetical protein
MAHVVMQAAEFASVDEATRAEAELQHLIDGYVAFEKTDPDPWSQGRVPPPLIAFGQRHGVEWPHAQGSRFLLKGLFEDEANLLRVDRMVFFWGGGFDLGGETLRAILGRMGAVACAESVHLVVAASDPEARLAELTSFLVDEDFEGQFEVVSSAADLEHALFSITLDNGSNRTHLAFDDSGIEDWAFVSLLPQLDGEDPRLSRDG